MRFVAGSLNGTYLKEIHERALDRTDSVKIAVSKAGKKTKDSIMASDAFFPKADSIDEAHRAGITTIIQPGGSIRDQEVIDACDAHGIAMVFTGKRHFKH